MFMAAVTAAIYPFWISALFLSYMFLQSDLLPAHKFDIFVAYHLKPLGVGVGWGGVGHVNVRLHLRHEVDATSRMGLGLGLGLGEVGWGMLTFACTCVMKLMLRYALGLGGVGWGMSTFTCTCVMKLMLRHAWGWGWVGWGGACQRSLALASWSWCYVTHGVGVGWGGVGHVNVRLHLRHEVDATLRMGLGLGGVGWGMLTFACTCVMKLMLRYGWGWGWVGWGGACQRSLALKLCRPAGQTSPLSGKAVSWKKENRTRNVFDHKMLEGLTKASCDELFLRNFFGPRMCVWLARERRFWEIMGRWKIRRDVFLSFFLCSFFSVYRFLFIYPFLNLSIYLPIIVF